MHAFLDGASVLSSDLRKHLNVLSKILQALKPKQNKTWENVSAYRIPAVKT